MIPDIQKEKPIHEIMIDSVGIKDLKFPIAVEDRANKKQNTIADISMFVELPHHYRGTHMSRFVSILHNYQKEFSLLNFSEILHEIRRELEAEKAGMEVKFTYFIVKNAPESSIEGIMNYGCVFYGSVGGENNEDFILEVNVPVITLCPCSKEISDRGAHSQRAMVKIQVRYDKFIWIEELIEIAEMNSSGPVFSMLKREDEKFVTEKAYDNPFFVEDVVRAVTANLLADDRITWFKVQCESFESIHNHSAYAVIERDKTNNNNQ